MLLLLSLLLLIPMMDSNLFSETDHGTSERGVATADEDEVTSEAAAASEVRAEDVVEVVAAEGPLGEDAAVTTRREDPNGPWVDSQDLPRLACVTRRRLYTMTYRRLPGYECPLIFEGWMAN